MALWKKRIHNLLSKVFGTCFKILCKIHLFRPKIIVMVDGGICSQMNQYLIGQIYAERGENVGYDLCWYERNGMDVDGRFARKFELEEMFPDIHLNDFGLLTTWFYRMFLMHTSLDQKPPKEQEGRIAPIYLGGYYSNTDDLVFSNQFERLFIGAKKAKVLYKLDTVAPNQHKCAVHVRRGDLARGDNPWYGGATDDYFFRAIAYVERCHPNTRFFFFSDEIDYVEKNLVPNLKIDYRLIKEPHKAFEDLLLISSCDTIIASQGSFGKYGALLNENSMLVIQDDKYATPWLNRKKNTVAI